MAVVFVGASRYNNQNQAQTWQVAAPPNLQVGDMMVLALGQQTATDRGWTFSGGGGGWTRLDIAVDTGTTQVVVYYRRATAGDIGATYTITNPQTQYDSNTWTCIAAYRNVTNISSAGKAAGTMAVSYRLDMLRPTADPTRTVVFCTNAYGGSSGGPIQRYYFSITAGLIGRMSSALGTDYSGAARNGQGWDGSIWDHTPGSSGQIAALYATSTDGGGSNYGGWGNGYAMVAVMLESDLPPNTPAAFTAGAVANSVVHNTHTVSWSASTDPENDVIREYEVDYSGDDGATWTNIAKVTGSPAAATLQVNFANYPPTSQARMRVRANDYMGGGWSPYRVSDRFTVFHGGRARRLKSLRVGSR